MARRKLNPSGEPPARVAEPQRRNVSPPAEIGSAITIRGEVTGQEDLFLGGRVEGRVEVLGHTVTIGPAADIAADIVAREVILLGRVGGNVSASERIEIGERGRIDGDVSAPKLLVHEGAEINGAIDMKPLSPVKPDQRSS